MNRNDFTPWHPIENLVAMYTLTHLTYENGLTLHLHPCAHFGTGQPILVHFEAVISYLCTHERYADGFWIGDKEKVWTFFRSSQSDYLTELKQTSTLFSHCQTSPAHYVFVTTEAVIHVIAEGAPSVYGEAEQSVTLELTQAEAVILSDLLWRNTENQQSITLLNAAERQVLWNVECLLEKQLPPDLDVASAYQALGDI